MELVERSRFTNNMHMHLFALMEQVADMAEDGIDDNLDPNCVKIFKRAAEQAEIIAAVDQGRTSGPYEEGQVGLIPAIPAM